MIDYLKRCSSLLAAQPLLLSMLLLATACGDAGGPVGTRSITSALSQVEQDRILRDRADVVFSSIRGAASDYPNNRELPVTR